MAFTIGVFVGTFFCLLIASLMRANDTVETCPACNGVCGIESAPGDWHDCELCDATGKVRT